MSLKKIVNMLFLIQLKSCLTNELTDIIKKYIFA